MRQILLAAACVGAFLVSACAPQEPFEEVTDPFASPLPPSPPVEATPITSNAAPGPTSPVSPEPIGSAPLAPPLATTPTVTPAPAQTSSDTDASVAGPPSEPDSDTVTVLNEGGLLERLPDTCRLEDYQQFAGQSGASAAAGVSDRPVRIIGPADIVTQEYNPQRVNFYTDGAGIVQRITCG